MKRVLLIQCDNLISGGIASLLEHAHGVKLLRKTIEDVPHLINEISDFCPSTLVLMNNLKFVTSSLLMELLGKFPDLRILEINESKNIIHVYGKQEINVTQSSDLLCLVRDSLI